MPRVGSNSWVVAGRRTDDRLPLLANDIHLALGLPSLWYELELEVPGELWVRGFSIPGAPGVKVGYNERLAWGFSATHADTQDLFLEWRHPFDETRFLSDGRWYDAQRRVESIAVAGRPEPEEVEIIVTRNGPLVAEDPDLSLRWTAFDSEKSIFNALLEMNTARDWPEFRRALRNWSLPFNVVYADLDGTIPIRT